MESEMIENTGGDTGEESGTVSLEESSDDELNSYLREAVSQEEGQTTDTTAVESDEDQSTNENQEEKPVLESKPAAPAVTPEQQLVEAQERNKKLEQDLAQVNHFVERKRSETAQLKAELAQRNKQLQELLPNLQAEDPDAWLDGKMELKQNAEQMRQLESEEQGLLARYHTQQAVTAHLKEGELDLNAMIECLTRDNVDPDYISRVKQDPYGTVQGDSFIHLAKRATAERALVGVYGAYKELEAKYNALEGKLKNKGEDLIRKIEMATKAKPTISSRNGSVGASDTSLNIDPGSLSDDQLKEALRRATQ